jgi:hypothetical protein
MKIKKSGLLFLSITSIITILILTLFFTTAANTTVNLGSFENSSSCLKTQIDAKTYSAMSIEELSASILALGYDSSRQNALKSELTKRKDPNNNCWPSGSCTIKETALVMLAYIHINSDITGIKNWLLNQTIPASDLSWYLQVHTENVSQCSIKYDNNSRTINLAENRQISGTIGSCLQITSDGYWLEISPSCYGKEFEVSCNNDFLVSTFYKRRSGETLFVTTSTQTSSPNSPLKTKVESLCFKQGSSCSYEASLWATYAINKKDNSFKDKALPYLIALATDTNVQRYFPAAFLYSITGLNEYLTAISNLQNSNGYWQLSEATKRYYDTALALMALYGHGSSVQTDAAISYLTQPNVQSNGCYNGNNIRDTAMIIYGANPKPAASGGGTTSQCTDFSSQGYSCTTSSDCNNSNGTLMGNFNCFSGLICCDKPSTIQTCSQLGGTKCSFGQECSRDYISSSDSTSCCPSSGRCEDTGSPITDECSDEGYTCKSSCGDDENEEALSCTAGVCCSEKEITPGPNYWWLYLLIILIILIILAVIFRNQLQVWWFKTKGQFQKKPFEPARPMPPRPMMPPLMPPRTIIPGQAPRPMMQPRPIARPFPKQKELDETLKKIKDMGGKQ